MSKSYLVPDSYLLPGSYLPNSYLPDSYLPDSYLPKSYLPGSYLPGSYLPKSYLEQDIQSRKNHEGSCSDPYPMSGTSPNTFGQWPAWVPEVLWHSGRLPGPVDSIRCCGPLVFSGELLINYNINNKIKMKSGQGAKNSQKRKKEPSSNQSPPQKDKMVQQTLTKNQFDSTASSKISSVEKPDFAKKHFKDNVDVNSQDVKGKLSVSFDEKLKSPAVHRFHYSAQKSLPLQMQGGGRRSQMAGEQDSDESVVLSGNDAIPQPSNDTLEELQIYLSRTCTKDVQVPPNVCHNLQLTGLQVERQRELKGFVNAEYVLIISADTSQVGVDKENHLCARVGDSLEKLDFQAGELPKIHFKVVCFTQTRRDLSPPAEVVVSLAELLHLIRNGTIEFFFGAFQDILIASTSAYCYFKLYDQGEGAFKNEKPVHITELERTEKEQSKKGAEYNRDSNHDLAKKLFSKQAIYKALELAKTILSEFACMDAFVKAKHKNFSIQYNHRKWYKVVVDNTDDPDKRQENYAKLFKAGKNSAVEKFTFPQFRLSVEQAIQVMDTSSAKTLFFDLVTKADNVKPPVQSEEQLIELREDNKKQMPSRQSQSGRQSQAAQRQPKSPRYHQQPDGRLSDPALKIQFLKNVAEQHTKPLQQLLEKFPEYDPQNNTQEDLLTQLAFNAKYSILREGKVDHLRSQIRRIHEYQKAPHYFSMFPSKFDSEGTSYDVVDFKRAMFAPKYGVMISYVEKEVKYGDLDRDSYPGEMSSTQKAKTKYGGGAGISGIQLLGAMYNQLADMLIIQDRAFMLQMLCLMLESPLESVQEYLEGQIHLDEGFYTFDNDFKFYEFKSKLDKAVPFHYKEGSYRSHILAYIAALPEVKIWLEGFKPAVPAVMIDGEASDAVNQGSQADGDKDDHHNPLVNEEVQEAKKQNDAEKEGDSFKGPSQQEDQDKGELGAADDDGKGGEQKAPADGEQIAPCPGPWVITVDYYVKGTIKTHYIVVKARVHEGRPQFICQHPSQGVSEQDGEFTDSIVPFFVDDVKRTSNKKCIGKAKDGVLKIGSETLYENPIHKCLGYLAKHNFETNQGNQGYFEMRVYDLQIVPLELQSHKSFKAIRYLFLHFHHPCLAKQSNVRSPQERQKLLEQGLLSFTYHCDHELVSKKAADVLSTMSSVIDQRQKHYLKKINKEDHRKNYYEALDALTRVFKLGYTLMDPEPQPLSQPFRPKADLPPLLETSEAEFVVVDQVIRLLNKLDVATPLTEGLYCERPMKLVRAVSHTKKKVQDLVDLNTFYDRQVYTEKANVMNLEQLMLEKDVFELSQDVLKESIVRSTELNFFMSFIFQGLVCGLFCGELTLDDLSMASIQREFSQIEFLDSIDDTIERVIESGGRLVHYSFYKDFGGKLECGDERIPLGFLHTPQLIAKYIVYMRDKLEIKVGINLQREDSRLVKMNQETLQDRQAKFDDLLQQDAPKMGQVEHEYEDQKLMMTQEEQKTMWAVRGEMWKPSGSKAGSNKKLWPDDLRRRVSAWNTVQHSRPDDEDSEQRKRDKKAQSKFQLVQQQPVHYQDRGQADDQNEFFDGDYQDEFNNHHRYDPPPFIPFQMQQTGYYPQPTRQWVTQGQPRFQHQQQQQIIPPKPKRTANDSNRKALQQDHKVILYNSQSLKDSSNQDSSGKGSGAR